MRARLTSLCIVSGSICRDFIGDAVTRGYVQNSWYLTNVFSGFEIWSGGVGLETTAFAVAVP